jgi:hypothetical protein
MFNKSRVLLLRIISEGKPIYNFRIKMQAILWKRACIIIQASADLSLERARKKLLSFSRERRH